METTGTPYKHSFDRSDYFTDVAVFHRFHCFIIIVTIIYRSMLIVIKSKPKHNNSFL